MKYKSYDEYKNSGVEWSTKIPHNWNVNKIKNICKIISGYAFKSSDFCEKGIIVIKINNIQFMRMDWNEKSYLPEAFLDKHRGFLTELNDIVIALTRPIISTGIKISQVKENIPMLINQRTCLLRVYDGLGINQKFMYYILMSDYFINQFKSYVKITNQPNISAEDIAKIKIYIPLVQEQKKIVEFLDKKSSEIDGVIEEKEKLIELLKEKREAIITEAVTKGVDKNVKMKESGLEWIAEIPSHWKKFRFKNICNINPNKSELTIDNERLVSFVPMENIKNGKIDLSIVKKLGEVYSGYSYFGDGDIIMAKVTPCFENGNIAIVEKMKNKVGFGTTELHVLRVNEKVNNKYLYYLLQENGFKSKAISSMYGVGGLKRIPTEFIANFEIYIPDVKEQIEIIKYIEGKLNNIDIILKETNKSIEKIKEYKKSLISEVITGKIDVRGCKG